MDFLVTFCVSITLCGDSYYILHQCYIMRRFLLHFVLVLHYAAILIPFCVSATLCRDSYYILCQCYIMRRFLLRFALVLHYAAILITFCVSITFCGDSYYILHQCYIIFGGDYYILRHNKGQQFGVPYQSLINNFFLKQLNN